MSLHSTDKDRFTNDGIDDLIHWALRDSVAGEEPSPHVWERIQGGVLARREAALASRPRRRKALKRRLWLSWLVGAGANFPVPGDPRIAWQRRLHAFDVRAPLSVLRMVEGKMATLRLVS